MSFCSNSTEEKDSFQCVESPELVEEWFDCIDSDDMCYDFKGIQSLPHSKCVNLAPNSMLAAHPCIFMLLSYNNLSMYSIDMMLKEVGMQCKAYCQKPLFTNEGCYKQLNLFWWPPPRQELNHQHRKKLLLTALAIALMKAYPGAPTLHMSSSRALNDIVHKSTGSNGMLKTENLSEEGAAQIRNALKELPAQLFTPEDSKYIIIDSGCSCTATGDMTDLIPSTVQVLQQPKTMDGIGGTINATHKGQFLYEFLADDGTIQKLQGECVYVPGLPCRFFSPQD